MSKLLLDEEPLVILPSLAVAIGLNEAIVLQQLHYWIKKSNHLIDGRKWVYNTIPEWTKQFPFWGEKTVRRTFDSLHDAKIVLRGNYNKLKTDRTFWYTIDYEKMKKVAENPPEKCKKKQKPKTEVPSGQSDQMEADKLDTSTGQNDHLQTDNMDTPLPEITSESTTEKDRLIDSEKENAQGIADEPYLEPKGNGMPLTDSDAVQSEILPKDRFEQVEQHYLMRRGGFCLAGKDSQIITGVLNEGIPVETIVAGIDRAFDTYEAKYSTDRIRAFSYCATVIRQMHYEKAEREKALRNVEQFVPGESKPIGKTPGGRRGYKNQRKDEIPPLIREQLERQKVAGETRRQVDQAPNPDYEQKQQRVQALLKAMGESKHE